MGIFSLFLSKANIYQNENTISLYHKIRYEDKIMYYDS